MRDTTHDSWLTISTQELTDALRTGAAGRYEAAAVELLAGLPHLYSQAWFRGVVVRAHHHTGRLQSATVMWQLLHTSIRRGALRDSPDDSTLVRLACDLVATPANGSITIHASLLDQLSPDRATMLHRAIGIVLGVITTPPPADPR